MRHSFSNFQIDMVAAKTGLFDQDLKTSATFFKALGHPARLTILKYLGGMQMCMTGDICDELPLSRTTVMQHLKALKKAGLIQGTVEGTRVNYCLNPCAIKDLKKISNDLLLELNISENNTCH